MKEYDQETIQRISDKANDIVKMLVEENTPPEALAIVGMICARIIYCFTDTRERFDEVSAVLANQIKDAIDAEEADGTIRWEKAD